MREYGIFKTVCIPIMQRKTIKIKDGNRNHLGKKSKNNNIWIVDFLVIFDYMFLYIKIFHKNHILY